MKAINIILGVLVVVGFVLLLQPVVFPMVVAPVENIPFRASVKPSEVTIPVGGSETVTITLTYIGPRPISLPVSLYVWEGQTLPVTHTPLSGISYGIHSELLNRTIVVPIYDTENVGVKIYVGSNHDASKYPSGTVVFSVSNRPPGENIENIFTQALRVKVNVVSPPIIPMEFTLTTFQLIGLCLLLPSIGALLRRR